MDRRVIKSWFNKIKAIKHLGGKCISCNTENVKHLSFHHEDSETKEYKISSKLGNSWDYIVKEIDKCSLLCINCHLKYHFYNDIKSDKIKTFGMKKRRRDSKKLFIEYKGGECEKCGYNDCNAALSFHHKDKSNKSFIISYNSKLFKSIEELFGDIKVELDKCSLLCANCHNEEHLENDVVDYVVSNYDNLFVRKISPKVDRELVKTMYNSGMTQTQIKKELNIGNGTIWRIIQEIKKS